MPNYFMITKKSIIDDIDILLTRFEKTDDSRLDDDFLSYKIDQIRAELIRAEYKVTNVLNQVWFQDLGMVPLHKVNFADDASVTSCECDISKTFLPQIVSLENGNGNQELGLNIMSACGKKKYHPYALAMWKDLPKEHTRSLFNYYARINTATYINKLASELRAYAILQSPEDGFTINSTPITSGGILSGVVYVVRYGSVIYDGVPYNNADTFTGVGETTFTGTGVVYLNSQKQAFTDTMAYPVTGDMARQIVIEICTKEFKIESAGFALDIKDDSKDDGLK